MCHFVVAQPGSEAADRHPGASMSKRLIAAWIALSAAACGGSTNESGGGDPDGGSTGGNGGSTGGTGGGAAGSMSGGSSYGGSAGTTGGSAGSMTGGSGGGLGDGGTAGAGGNGDGGSTARVPAKHRATASACDATRPYQPLTGIPPDAGAPYVECRTHDDCPETSDLGTNGRCTGNGHDGWYCTYDNCMTDEDCFTVTMGQRSVCECDGAARSGANVCISGNCLTDADCGVNYCSPSLGDCGAYGGVSYYYCHTAEDECVDDADCGGSGMPGEPYCAYSHLAGQWRCSDQYCAG
jgi:hypothetical protein